MKNVGKTILLSFALLLSGCATTTSNNASDPFEGFNRTMFSFNDTVDRVALKPAATAYKDVLPSFVQTAIGNFFGNIGDVWTMVNNFLQGKVQDGSSDFMRVAVNSTLGFGGVLDIASEAGLQKHKEDFGQTLGKWGVKSGPYVVLPLLGPSTVRDTAALPADIYGDLWTYTTPVDVRNSGIALRVVDERAAALNATNLLEDAALDRYSFVRSAYLQRRAGLVNDGEIQDEAPEDSKEVGPQSEATQALPADESIATAPAAVEPAGIAPVEPLANDATGPHMEASLPANHESALN